MYPPSVRMLKVGACVYVCNNMGHCAQGGGLKVISQLFSENHNDVCCLTAVPRSLQLYHKVHHLHVSVQQVLLIPPVSLPCSSDVTKCSLQINIQYKGQSIICRYPWRLVNLLYKEKIRQSPKGQIFSNKSWTSPVYTFLLHNGKD